MNSKLNFIFSRRSIRKYQSRKVEQTLIQDLLEAGMAVPSAMCKDPWSFLVVQEQNILNSLGEVLPNGKFLVDSPLVIVVCGDIKQAHINSISYLLQDCTCAIENILLAANALELGGCYLGIHPREERIEGVKKLFDLPENIIPVGAISIGYPAEIKESRTRYNANLIKFF